MSRRAPEAMSNKVLLLIAVLALVAVTVIYVTTPKQPSYACTRSTLVCKKAP